jgi:hypothetical protein
MVGVTVRASHSKPPGRHLLVLALVLALVGAVAASRPSSSAARPLVAGAPDTPAGPAVAGRASAVALHGILGDQSVGDTGDVREAAAAPKRVQVLDLRLPLVRVAVAEGSVVVPDSSSIEARAAVTDLRVDLTGNEGAALLLGDGASLLSIAVSAVTASARSDCAAGSTGAATIGSITINGIRLTIDAAPGSNARIAVAGLPLVTVLLNEQVPEPVAGGSGLLVNAVHIVVADLLELVVGSARAQVGACPPPPPPPVLDVSPGIVRQGRVATAKGSGFPPSSAVEVSFDGPDIPPAVVTSAADGTVDIPVVVRRDARLGTRTLSAASGRAEVSATFLVVRPPEEPPGAPFPPGFGLATTGPAGAGSRPATR